MKLIVERDKFADAVTAAMRAADGGNTIPILRNLLLKPNGASVGIAGTRLDMQLETAVDAEISGKPDDAITLPGDALVDIVSRMPKGAQVAIEWDTACYAHATLASGRGRYKLLSLPFCDFPELMQTNKPAVFSMPGKQLAAGLTVPRFAMGKDRSRHFLQGIYMHAASESHPAIAPSRETALRFAATDFNNMAICSFPLPDGASDIPGVAIPATAIPEIVRLATESGEAPVEISVTLALLAIKTCGKTFTTKLIDGTFPDYPKGIPTDFVSRGVVDSEELSGALSRLLAVANDKRMRCTIGDGTFRLQLANHAIGEADEEVSIEWEGPSIELAMNTRALLSVLESADSDQCLMRFVDPRKAVLIQPWRAGVVDTSRTYLTMPME